jgi:uncharacterized Zn-finger protein
MSFQWSFQSFFKSSFLTHHKVIQSSVKKYKCRSIGCNKRFKTRAQLKTNSYIHSGVKPFVWSYEECNQKFSQKSHLNERMKRY